MANYGFVQYWELFSEKVMEYYLDSKKSYGAVKLCKTLNDIGISFLAELTKICTYNMNSFHFIKRKAGGINAIFSNRRIFIIGIN